MATKSRRCKYGKLKTPVKTKNGGKRMCKKKKSRKRKSRKKCKYNKLKTPTKYGRRCSKRCAKGKLKKPKKSGRVCRKKRSYKMGNPPKHYGDAWVADANTRSGTRSGGVLGGFVESIAAIPSAILESASSLLGTGPTNEQLNLTNELTTKEFDEAFNGN